MKPVRIAPPAADEFTEAIRWYEEKRAGLGGEFYDAVDRAIDLIREHPAIGLSIAHPTNHRQFLVDRFPFKVVYRERTDDILIVCHRALQPAPRILEEPAALIDSG